VARWPLYVAGSLLVLTLAAFAALFVIDSVNYQDTVQGDVPAETLTETTYLDQVAPLLAQADPANGDALLTQFDCAGACRRRVRRRDAAGLRPAPE
jgi:hypothetical protein